MKKLIILSLKVSLITYIITLCEAIFITKSGLSVNSIWSIMLSCMFLSLLTGIVYYFGNKFINMYFICDPSKYNVPDDKIVKGTININGEVRIPVSAEQNGAVYIPPFSKEKSDTITKVKKPKAKKISSKIK